MKLRIPVLATLRLGIIMAALLWPGLSQGQISKYKAYFEEAYQKYPVVPPGLLEAVAYTNTRVNHLQAKPGCQELPTYYGVMGLVEDGKGYFQNTLARVAELSGFDAEQIKTDPRTNILAYAAAYAATQATKRLTTRSVDAHEPVLAELTEIPQDGSTHNAFALDQQFYAILKEMEAPHTDSRFRTRQAFNYQEIFGAENFKVLSADWVEISRTGVRTRTATFTPQTTCTAQNGKPDFAGALWNAAHTRNYGSRDGEPVKYVTIHTIQGSYASCISWFKNPNARVSAHYVIRASDGQVTQMVCENDKAYHVRTDNGNAIGIEHEGFIDDGGAWYTNEMYEASAALVRDICQRHGIDPLKTFGGPPTDGVRTLTNTCYHVKGHQHFRGNNHIDPGPFWDWNRYYQLINPMPDPQVFTAKSGEFTDPGGAGKNYGDQQRTAYLIKPEGASSVTLSFLDWELEGSAEQAYDYLDIYDGENANGQYLGRFTGTQRPADLVSRSGAFFLEFRSDCQINKAGWRIRYTSRKRNPDCPNPTKLVAGNIFPMGATLSWEGEADSYRVFLRRNLENRWASFTTTTNSLTVTGLSANGLYQWQVQAICGRDSSAIIGESFLTPNISRSGRPQVFTVQLREGRFHDTGGTFSGYSNDENYLYRIIPPRGGEVEITFTAFETEEEHDVLTVYDGPNLNGAKLGTYSGKVNPGTLRSRSGSLTLHFQSDGRTNGPGWAASWRTLGGETGPVTPPPTDPQPTPQPTPQPNPQPDPVPTDPDPVPTDPDPTPTPTPDPTPPAGSLLTLSPDLTFSNANPETRAELKPQYEAGTFSVSFADRDRSGRGLANQFYNVAYLGPQGYAGRAEAGFFYDDFDGGLRPEWTAVAGTWQVERGILHQRDASIGNSNLHAPLRQTNADVWVYHWQARMEGGTNNRRHGLHFFCSAPGEEDRGTSYFVWVRDSDQGDFIEIYKTVENQFDRKVVKRVEIETGKAYDYKAIFNPEKGRIEVYLDNRFVVSWVDRFPLFRGAALSLRSAGCQVAYDNLIVYKAREGQVNLKAGTSARDPLPPGGRFAVHSLIVDRNIRWSQVGRSTAQIGGGAAPEPAPRPGESGNSGALPPVLRGDVDLNLPGATGSQRFFLPAGRRDGRWAAATDLGFLTDDFAGSSLQPAWKAVRGRWEVRDGVLQHQDESEGNANLFLPLAQQGSQVYLYHWRARVRSEGDNRRFGLHFFCSDGQALQRGNSYMVWFRYRETRPDLIEVYRFDNDNAPVIRASRPVTINRNQWYDVKVSYDPSTGTIEAFLDDQPVLTWKDNVGTPLRQGSSISLRTGDALVDFDDLHVYQLAPTQPVRITVGNQGMIRAQSQGAAPAARIYTLIREASGRWLPAQVQEARVE